MFNINLNKENIFNENTKIKFIQKEKKQTFDNISKNNLGIFWKTSIF